jgi:DNA-binding transcriptional MerR regulator
VKRADRSTPARDHKSYPIGEVTRLTGLSADTLRYYEKIGLLPRVERNAAGLRRYNDKDVSRLRFIRRAQTMDFSLAEIAALLAMREAPQRARRQARELTQRKLGEIEARLAEMKTLRNELKLLINLCNGSGKKCPIIVKMDRQ